MRVLRLAATVALMGWASTSPTSAGLVLVAGVGPATLPINNYGFSGTYTDLEGPRGASEKVAHPGGGPVAFLYVFSSGGGIATYYDSGAGPFDGADDTQVGVLNNSSQALFSFGVTSMTDIYGFDGDGIDTFGAPSNSLDTKGYGGPQAYFTSINPSNTSGTVNFAGGVAANGGTTYFSFEEAPTIMSIPTAVPEPSSLIMACCGVVLALVHARRRGIARV